MIVKHVWYPQQPPRKKSIADRIAAKVDDSNSQHESQQHVERPPTTYETSVEQNGQ